MRVALSVLLRTWVLYAGGNVAHVLYDLMRNFDDHDGIFWKIHYLSN